MLEALSDRRSAIKNDPTSHPMVGIPTSEYDINNA